MAKLRSGILGGISGKVGNVVGGRWRGIDYIRTKPAQVKNPNTEAQQKQRMRFKLVIQFLKKISPLVNVGFQNRGKNQTPQNAAMAYNLKQAITGEFPDMELDPAKIVFSEGSLQPAQGASMDTSVPETVTISWISDTASANASESDGAMILIYNPAKDEVVYNMFGSTRGVESHEQSIPAHWAGDEVAGYLAFRSESGNEVSQNQYLGMEIAAVVS